MLPFVLGAVVLAVTFRELKRTWPFALATAAGFAGALLAGLLVLLSLRISPADAWRMVVTYNGAVQNGQSFGFGMARNLFQNPLCLLYVLPGLAACVVMLARRHWFPKPHEIAVFVFLVLNLCTTTRPWKQYTASWFLLAAALPARSLPLLAARFNLRTQVVLAGGLLVTALLFFQWNCRADPTVVDRAAQDRSMKYVLKQVPEDGYVLSGFNNHPVFRRDALFATVQDLEWNGADGLEQFMPQLAPGPYGEQFEESGYEKELESHPPALILREGG